MELLIKVADILQNLEKKQFKKYMLIILGCATFILGSVLYFIYNKSTFLINDMRRIERIAKKSVQIIADAQKLKEEEDHILNLLNKYQNFELQGDFEQFCKEQGVTPEPGWAASVEILNSKFNEEILPAVFHHQTTEKMVTFLQALEKKEIVYIKSLSVKTEKDKFITFEISIATKKKRQ